MTCQTSSRWRSWDEYEQPERDSHLMRMSIRTWSTGPGETARHGPSPEAHPEQVQRAYRPQRPPRPNPFDAMPVGPMVQPVGERIIDRRWPVYRPWRCPTSPSSMCPEAIGDQPANAMAAHPSERPLAAVGSYRFV